MKLGIIGSRRRCSPEDKRLVRDKILELNPSMIISGGCARGADSFAEEFARLLGVSITIFYPKPPVGRGRQHWIKAYYERNQRIALESDHLIALVAPDRRGGTENTINYFKERNLLTWKDFLEIL